MLKKMIEERMTQLERSMGNGKPNDKLMDRLVSLEKENKALKEYAKRVEESVKNILNAEKEKAKQKVTQAVQTQDPSWVSLFEALLPVGEKLLDAIEFNQAENRRVLSHHIDVFIKRVLNWRELQNFH